MGETRVTPGERWVGLLELNNGCRLGTNGLGGHHGISGGGLELWPFLFISQGNLKVLIVPTSG